MRAIFAIFSALLLSACVLPGQSSYQNDPLTGGIDAKSSALLHIPLPPGLQYYPSHSKISGGARKEGLETLRGYVDQATCGANFYTKLRQTGWNLRMHEKSGSRAIYIYQKDTDLAALVFQAQGMLTIVQVWTGPRLADNAALYDRSLHDEETPSSLPGETYGPAEKDAVEIWGVEEKEL